MNSFDILLCPVCGKELLRKDRVFTCENGHSFDLAKEGYVNLLCGKQKSGERRGDNAEMAKSRRDFLSKGYYSCLSDALISLSKDLSGNALDICCGEGWYTEKLAEASSLSFFGFDLSKEMVRLAAKRKSPSFFFVANLASIPLKNESIDFAMHLFAPWNEDEFSRILKSGGTLVSVTPGKSHLFGLKKVVYGKPYLNEETPPPHTSLTLTDRITVKDEITLECGEDIKNLFMMTPYAYKSPKDGVARLFSLSELTCEVEFILNVFKK